MKRLGILYACILTLAIVTAAGRAQQWPVHSALADARLTDSESLWTGRFSYCDLRYYVLIPPGFVAHGNRPPSPIHGFLFGLPDTGTTDVVSVDDKRFIRVLAEPNSLGLKSSEEVADHVLDYMGKEKSGFEIRTRQYVRLDGMPATRVRAE